MNKEKESGKIDLDTLSIYKALFEAIESNSIRQQAEIQTRIFESVQIKIEDDMINKFQLANRENIQKMETIRSEISSSIDSLNVKIGSLKDDTKSLKDDNRSLKAVNKWDRVSLLLGFITVAAAIFFGLHH